MLAVLLNDILPILLVAGVGFLLARVARIDVGALARLAFHALAPCLIFMLLVTSQASGRELVLMAVSASPSSPRAACSPGASPGPCAWTARRPLACCWR